MMVNPVLVLESVVGSLVSFCRRRCAWRNPQPRPGAEAAEHTGIRNGRWRQEMGACGGWSLPRRNPLRVMAKHLPMTYGASPHSRPGTELVVDLEEVLSKKRSSRREGCGDD
jgi:hypothetical protein